MNDQINIFNSSIDAFTEQLGGKRSHQKSKKMKFTQKRVKNSQTDHQESGPELQFGSPVEEYNLEQKMLEDHTYPSPSQKNFQEATYIKRDFYIHAIPYRQKIDSYEEVKEFRDNKCARDFKLTETQTLLSNFINPNTPYKGVLIYHGTGVGKTCAAVAIAEKFKHMIEKYGTRIHVLVPGPLNKQNFLI